MKVPLFSENFAAIFRIDFQYISRIRTMKGYSKAFVIKVFIPKIRKALLNSNFSSELFKTSSHLRRKRRNRKRVTTKFESLRRK